ncbi:MAG: restriction endonuclease subunit S [Caldilineaceae bacterium]
MNAKQFLAEFGTISSAPDGVQRIRELILQMAVSGRLVQYDRTEDTIEADIHEARRLRIQYREELKLKNSRTRSTFRQEEIPYPIPVHWRWQRLEQIASYIQRGKGPKYANSGAIRVVSQKCVRWDGFELSPARYLDPKVLNSYGNERFLQPDDLLWNSTGTGTVGRVAIYKPEQNVDTVADSHVTVVRLSNFIPRYVWCVIASPWVQARIAPEHEDSLVSGTTNQVELSTSSVRGLQIPCPPIEEQQRIVAKVDELMALCDKLEAQQRERESLCQLTRKASLASLANAQNVSDLEKGWTRFADGFPLWSTDADAVAEIKNAISFLACRGILTGVMPAAEISDNDTPTLPEGWTWVSLGRLSAYITSGSRGWKKYMSPQGDSFIRSQDIKHNELIFENPVFVNLPEKVEGTRTLVRPGDLLMTITGANVGKCAQVPLLSQKAYVSQHVALIRIKDTRQTPFIHWWLINTYGGQKHLAEFVYGDKPGLNLTQVRNIPIPLPPISTQEKILTVLKVYSDLCDQLADQVKEARDTAESLASAAVSAITGIRSQEKTMMKVPKTELVSILNIGTVPTDLEQTTLAQILIRNNGQLTSKMLWNLSDLDIDAFYQQLKVEMANGWIVQPEVAYVKEEEAT